MPIVEPAMGPKRFADIPIQAYAHSDTCNDVAITERQSNTPKCIAVDGCTLGDRDTADASRDGVRNAAVARGVRI